MKTLSQGDKMKYHQVTLGQIEAVINKLGGVDGVSNLLAGRSEILNHSHVIDSGQRPSVKMPNEFSIERHQSHGKLRWDSSKADLYVAEGQKNRRAMLGKQLCEELHENHVTVLNATVMEYLLLHPRLIPEGWRRTKVAFWGTVYCESMRGYCRRYVPYIFWNQICWQYSYVMYEAETWYDHTSDLFVSDGPGGWVHTFRGAAAMMIP